MNNAGTAANNSFIWRKYQPVLPESYQGSPASLYVYDSILDDGSIALVELPLPISAGIPFYSPTVWYTSQASVQ